MKELTALRERLIYGVEQAVPGLRSVSGFPDLKRPNPLKRPFAVVSLQKVEISPLGLGEVGNELGGLGYRKTKRLEAEFRITLCSPSDGEECWTMFEQIAEKLAFDGGFQIRSIECGELKAGKDWGGILLPVKVRCLFGVWEEHRQEQQGIRELRIGAKC